MKINEPTLFDNINNNTPFHGVRIYLSGTLSRSTQEINFKLANAGAITKMGLAKTTCVIIAGDDQNQDDIIKIATLKNDGFDIPIITESEMYDLLSGKKYKEFKEPIKDINITYDFIFSKQFPKIIHINAQLNTHPLGQKEIFINKKNANKYVLWQAIGNIGAYVTAEFDPKTTDYCWLETDTIRQLRNGEKDEFIKCIADAYNKSDSDKFTYKFLLSEEVIEWMRLRAKRIEDFASIDLIDKYNIDL